MSDGQNEQTIEFKIPEEIAYEYLKAKFHRVIVATGVHGGPTPSGKYIAASVFSERIPIPKREVYAVGSDGQIGSRKDEKTESREAFVREVDATVLLDIDVARKLHEWLGRNITLLQQLIDARSRND